MELLCKITFNFIFRAFGFGSLPFRGGNFHFGNRAYNCNSQYILGTRIFGNYILNTFWEKSLSTSAPLWFINLCSKNENAIIFLFSNSRQHKRCKTHSSKFVFLYSIFYIQFFFTNYHETMHSNCWLFSKKVSGG